MEDKSNKTELICSDCEHCLSCRNTDFICKHPFLITEIEDISAWEPRLLEVSDELLPTWCPNFAQRCANVSPA